MTHDNYHYCERTHTMKYKNDTIACDSHDHLLGCSNEGCVPCLVHTPTPLVQRATMTCSPPATEMKNTNVCKPPYTNKIYETKCIITWACKADNSWLIAASLLTAAISTGVRALE